MRSTFRRHAVAACAALLVACVLVAPAAGAQSSAPVALPQWAAKFCTAFAVYEQHALSAQSQLDAAFAGVADANAGAAATASMGDAFRATSTSARAAGVAATANGVPDVAHGKALAREIQQTLVLTSKAYTSAAKRLASAPTAPKQLSKMAKSIASDLANALDPKGPHAKRLKQLDTKNAVAKAISSDPTCTAAANGSAASASGTTTTTP